MRSGWLQRMIVALTVGVLVASCSSDSSKALVVDDDQAQTADYEFLIPAGTGERIRAGEDIAILPAEMDVRVGEVIWITNEDDEGHFIGIFYVGPNEQVSQRFASEGEFVGNCTVHPSGQIALRVSQ